MTGATCAGAACASSSITSIVAVSRDFGALIAGRRACVISLNKAFTVGRELPETIWPGWDPRTPATGLLITRYDRFKRKFMNKEKLLGISLNVGPFVFLLTRACSCNSVFCCTVTDAAAGASCSAASAGTATDFWAPCCSCASFNSSTSLNPSNRDLRCLLS